MEFYWGFYAWARSESHKLIRFLSKYLLWVKPDAFNNPGPKIISKIALHFIEFPNSCPFLTSTRHPSPTCSQCSLLSSETAVLWGIFPPSFRGRVEKDLLKYSIHLVTFFLAASFKPWSCPSSPSPAAKVECRSDLLPAPQCYARVWNSDFWLQAKGWTHMSAGDVS